MLPQKKGAKKSPGMAGTSTSSTEGNSGSTAVKGPNPVICVQNALKRIRLDPYQESKNKEILEHFLENLIRVMKEQDKHFASVFQKRYYTGSYYEKLRISDPNEFDINLILNLPFKPDVREIEFVRNVKSFVKYKLKTQSENNDVLRRYEDLRKELFEGEYLMPLQVRRWMQSIVDRSLKSVPLPPGVKKINPGASGPAKTMYLETKYGYNIDIDLVPVIQFSYPEWPKGARKDMLRTFQVRNEEQFWFLVPKDFSADGTDVNPIDSKRLWRIHFPEVEKKIIHNRGFVKPLIRLLKVLRDRNNWKSLASYYLKTVVLWLVEKNPAVEHYREDKIYDRLLEVLEALKDSVSKKMIKYYFYPDFNLIQKMGSSEATIISNTLDKIIRDIKTNPEKIEHYFKV